MCLILKQEGDSGKGGLVGSHASVGGGTSTCAQPGLPTVRYDPFVVLFTPPDSLREVAYLGNSHAALKFDAFIQNSGGWYTSSVNVREMGKYGHPLPTSR
jgi:hypothetical protein